MEGKVKCLSSVKGSGGLRRFGKKYETVFVKKEADVVTGTDGFGSFNERVVVDFKQFSAVKKKHGGELNVLMRAEVTVTDCAKLSLHLLVLEIHTMKGFICDEQI